MIRKYYLLVSVKYPYRAYKVGSKENCEEALKLKKYSSGYYIRENLNEFDGQYSILYEGGLTHCIGMNALEDNLKQRRGTVTWFGTKNDWWRKNNYDKNQEYNRMSSLNEIRKLKIAELEKAL